MDFEEIKVIWNNVMEAWEAKQYGVAVGNLVVLAEKFKAFSPDLAPALGLLIESYGAAAKPFFDQLFDSGTKTAAYFIEQLAEAKKSLLPQFEKHEEVKAVIYAMKLRMLKKAKFTRTEAMDIILAEISGAKMTRQPWADFAKNSNISLKRGRGSYGY
jgi:hypothetical protein